MESNQENLVCMEIDNFICFYTSNDEERNHLRLVKDEYMGEVFEEHIFNSKEKEKILKFNKVLYELDKEFYDDLSDYSKGVKDVLNLLFEREFFTPDDIIKEIQRTNKIKNE